MHRQIKERVDLWLGRAIPARTHMREAEIKSEKKQTNKQKTHWRPRGQKKIFKRLILKMLIELRRVQIVTVDSSEFVLFVTIKLDVQRWSFCFSLDYAPWNGICITKVNLLYYWHLKIFL